MNKFRSIILLLGLIFIIAPNIYPQSVKTDQASSSHQRLSLDKGWRFYLGDIPFPEVKGHRDTYNNAKAGRAKGAAASDFDDSDWRMINLPHDWAVEEPFDYKANISQGYRPRGIGWYRRSFKLDPSDRGKHVELQFDGIVSHCTIWFNGTLVHRNFCGYTSSYIDVTPMLRYGNDLNCISVRVDAVTQEGWWYEGAGIYRHTWLVKRDPVHIATDGIFAQPIKIGMNLWNIPAEVTIENTGKTTSSVEVEMALIDDAGKTIAQARTNASVNTIDQTIAAFSLPVSNPKLWSIDNPILYKVKTTVKQNGIMCDELITHCGFRTIHFSADSGFLLNDKPVKIKGVCTHQDAAGVGVAVPNSIWDFRLRKLKEMGTNAIRSAHNPPSTEFLDACDRVGIMIMDENRNFNSTPEYIRQLQWMVRRDRNHPSVILWSVFNEEPTQGTEMGYEMVRRMRAEVKKLDKTRPVTAAMNGGLFAEVNVSQAADVVGFNYQPHQYDRFHQENPTLPMTSSEDVSCVMQRGQYVTDKNKRLLDEYDTQYPSWGTTHRNSWKSIAERPFMAGCFVWTGFDYRGEPTPYSWPTVNSNFGIMDLCGFPKSAFYIYQSQWLENKNTLQIVPHWNWPADSIGKNIKVMLLTNADKVKLLLNGKLLFEKAVDKYEMVTENVVYLPGKLEAIGYKNEKEISRCMVETTGEPVSVELIPDRSDMEGDGWDAMPVTIRVLDAKGRPVPTANLPVEFEISGPGNIIGLGNGDPNSHEPEKGNKRSLFNGLAQITIQTIEGGSTPIVIKAKSEGLKSALLTVNVKAKASVPFVSVPEQTLLIDNWRISPFSMLRPNPNQEIAENDMNSWAPIKVGQLLTFTDGRFAIYRTTFKPFSGKQRKYGQVELKAITGKAEVWIDNQLVGTKNNVTASDFVVALPAGQGERTISVLIEAKRGVNAGLGGLVKVY